MVRYIGAHIIAVIREAGDFALFTGASFLEIFKTRYLLRRVLRAIYEQGVRCLPVILIVGIFTGLVLGLLGYHILSSLGAEGFLGTLVSLALARELAPVLTALMIVGQAGSALASELGIQRNSEQIAALETMGIAPVGYLVSPRMIGAFFTYPILTVLYVLIGLYGGYVSGCLVMQLQSGVYWSAVENAVAMRDVQECLIKALVFGLLTTAICSYNGYNTHLRGSSGARAVGAATTRAVVLSSVAILASDYIITAFLVRS